MIMWKCRNCGGEYTNEQISGMLNFIPIEVPDVKKPVVEPKAQPIKSEPTPVKEEEYEEDEEE